MSANLAIDSTSRKCCRTGKITRSLNFPEQLFTVEENSTMEISSNSGKYALAYAPGDEFPKSVNLEDPSVT
jgi:DNA polymerase-3 subunit beta